MSEQSGEKEQMDVRSLVGQRVHVWQPLGLTSRVHIYGTLARLSGPAEGLPTLHLTDVVKVRPDQSTRVRTRPVTLHWSLNWSLEPADIGSSPTQEATDD